MRVITRARTHTTRHKTDSTQSNRVYVLLQTRTALRRGVPCHVRKVNCALNQTQRRKTLMATAAREDVAGGCTAFAAAWLMMTTKITASAARASPRPANARRQQQTADSAERAQFKRPKATNGESKKAQPRGGPCTAQLAGTRASTGREEEDEQEDSGDENTGLARRAPPAYGEP